ncbi:MAG: hypothetical protein B7X34_08425, partial [Acidobacteriia bacterium 12-62-4]
MGDFSQSSIRSDASTGGLCHSGGMTEIPGIKVGHASDFEALTGCTVILCEGGAVAGVDIGGAATGTQELDTMCPLHVTGLVHGIVFSGGSAFG